ncbi:hypothetical protein [Brevundimonas nasdae]|uniref:Autotransporter domain-containing protein n=1 Tax=Brevundimonas nasdae TaxID=172043 RepID=A0ABX8TP44_9CAUL|nr:hypothetical protein [Brevundimonas nasdae]QYC11745.1 hypothetical protein KWG56_07270 [Brevundimonas nasdae]QYC14531.1 hypothetical protein KWG63_02605 [Brevundimonas nasdae]
MAAAGAWTQPKGQGQVIVKYEDMRADEGFDPSGDTLSLLARRRDAAVGLFAEYGLTDRLTLQLKADWQSGEDAFVDYEGRGPVELGLTWKAWRDDHNAVSLYAGYAEAGEGRNAGYAAPGVGGHDWEMRVSAGRSLKAGDRLGLDSAFVEVQAARRLRSDLPDETRADFTVGGRFGGHWMVMGQAFGGAADGGARWASIEGSLVRDLGEWSVQAGWRETVAGRETPIARGFTLAIWRRF